MKTVSSTDSKSPRRVDDSRQWNTVNLRCTTCRGSCPICSVACCRYAEAKQTIADTEAKPEKSDNARQILQKIEGLGSHVKDMSTFSLCSEPGGCGRRVCPSCCGRCPSEMCGDIQCKVVFFLFCLLLSHLRVPIWWLTLLALGMQAKSLGTLRLARLKIWDWK